MPRTRDSDTKGKILEAAAKLFYQHGFKKTTMDEVAAEANIGKGSIYLHFKTKDEIFCEIAKTNADKRVSLLRDKLKKVKGPVNKLRFILRWRPESVYRFREMYNHSNEILLETRKELMYKIGKGPMEKYIGMIEATLKEGKKERIFRVKSPRLMAKHINYMGFAFMPPYRLIEGKKEILQQVDKYTEMVIGAINVN